MPTRKGPNPRITWEIGHAFRIIQPQDSWFRRMSYYFKASFLKWTISVRKGFFPGMKQLASYSGGGLNKNSKYYLLNSLKNILDSRNYTCPKLEVGRTVSYSKTSVVRSCKWENMRWMWTERHESNILPDGYLILHLIRNIKQNSYPH